MKRIALLPMKANSERVPGKNFRDLCGKPLFKWMLDCLLQLDSIEKVVINTDARTQLESYGVKESARIQIRDRRRELTGDLVSMNRIIEDDLAAVDADSYLMTHTTNPLLSAHTIQTAIDQLAVSGRKHDSLFSVTRLQARFYTRNAKPINHSPKELLRTQDLDPMFEENSCLYLFSRESFATTGARIGRKPLMFETPKLESIDIDDSDDWYISEALLTKQLQA